MRIFKLGTVFVDTRSANNTIFKLLTVDIRLINDRTTIVLRVLQWKIVEHTITIEFEDLDHFVRHMKILGEEQDDE